MERAVATALQSSTPPVDRAPPASVSVAAPTSPTPSWPEQLQQHAEDALRQADYSNAQDLAMQSWRQGTHRGALCQRNWEVIAQARLHNARLGSADAARKQANSCLAGSASP